MQAGRTPAQQTDGNYILKLKYIIAKPITQMADDLFAVSRQAIANGSDLHAVVPVGTAWNRAMRDGVADPNPYDGIDFGKVSLWA